MSYKKFVLIGTTIVGQLLSGTEKEIIQKVEYYCLFDTDPTVRAKFIVSFNARRAFQGILNDDTSLFEKKNLLKFIEQHAKEIDAWDAMKHFLITSANRAIGSLKEGNQNPLFLDHKTLSSALSIFHNVNLLINKDDIIKIISKIKDPLLLNTLIYKNDILQYYYSIPKHNLEQKTNSPQKNDFMKKGSNLGIKTSAKVLNVFRKEENPINRSSEAFSKNKPLLPIILANIRDHTIILDNKRVILSKQSDHEKIFLKAMFEPRFYKKLPAYRTLCMNAQKKILNFLLCCKNFSLKNKNIIPKPIQYIIIKKFATYERAERIRDYILTEVTLLNLDYLDGKERYNQDSKEIIDFIKTELLVWFDNKVSQLL